MKTSGAPRRPRSVSAWYRAGGALAALTLLRGGALAAQEPDRGEAYGIYRPAPPPAADTAAVDPSAGETSAGDTAAPPAPASTGGGLVLDVPAALAADSAPGDSGLPRAVTPPARRATAPPARDTATTRRDTTAARAPVRDIIEQSPEDTSLTARMDVGRGGGLRREEFPLLGETARLTGRYGVLLTVLERAGLAARLADTVALTIVAPTDSAFARLDPADLRRLQSDSAAAAAWAWSVLVPGDRTLSALLGADSAVALSGEVLRVERGPGGTGLVGGARVVQPDLIARNGRLHGVDRVPSAAAAGATSAAP